MAPRAAVLAIVIVLGGCQTTYQPQGFTGGFSELKLSADTYQITAKGNGLTSPERARDIALLRAAELTLQDGFERFAVLDGGVRTTTAGFTPVTANRLGNTVLVTGGDPITRPTGTLTVRMVKAGDPAFAGALDAQLIAAQLRPRLT